VATTFLFVAASSPVTMAKPVVDAVVTFMPAFFNALS
jgi:hypothetical protein